MQRNQYINHELRSIIPDFDKLSTEDREAYIAIYQNSAYLNVLDGHQLEDDLKLVMSKAKERAKTRNLSIVPFIRIAASILLVATAAFSIYFLNLKTITTGGSEQKQIVFHDGSEVFLNKNSYIEYSPLLYKLNIRRVVSFNGEAVFSISHNKKMPFTVKMPVSEVKVLGTEFLIKINNNKEIVSLFKGKIVFNNQNFHDTLTPNQQIAYDYVSGSYSKGIIENPNIRSWQTKKLQYQNTPLIDVVKDLENVFSNNIELDEKLRDENYTITATFENQSLNEILSEIKILFDLEIVSKEKFIFIKKKT